MAERKKLARGHTEEGGALGRLCCRFEAVLALLLVSLLLCSRTDKRVTGGQSCSNTPEARHCLESWQWRGEPYFWKEKQQDKQTKQKVCPSWQGIKKEEWFGSHQVS